MKLFEMFAGYGGASFALKKAGIDFECVGVSEIDKYAMQCFTQNHKGYHYGNCTQINANELPDFDLLTGGFPCQSFSVAGKGLGELDTRGTLFNEIIRIAEVKQPKYMLLENVKGLTYKPHKETFAKILSELERIGYSVKWKVLNSKEHGTPQNRERVFFVCFLDFYDEFDFKFPEKEELKIFLKDILEEDVDEKYNISDKMLQGLLKHNDNHNKKGTGFIWKPRDINSYASSLRSNGAFCPTDNSVLLLDMYNKKIKEDGICITLSDPCHNNLRIMEPVSLAIRNKNRSKHQTKGLPYGTFPKEYHLKENKEKGVSYAVKQSSHEFMVNNGLRIRKLTPKECFRLMGFLDDRINLDGLSNTQKYKLAGNGWDINLVSKIFKEMFK